MKPLRPLPPGLAPQPALRGTRPYHVPRAAAPTDLKLDGNEGATPDPSLFAVLGDVEVLRAYPDASRLEADLAARLHVSPDRVIVTAGADEAIDRLCRIAVSPERDEVLLPEPTFEMIHRYARLAGGRVVGVPWLGAWPRAEVLARIGARTALVFLVSPNNPTGAVVSAADVAAVADTGVLVVLDHAYVEFADQDLTSVALEHPNVVVLRTLSKARGLAGLRIGYAGGHPEVIGWMRAGGAPYPVSGVAVALARASLARGDGPVDAFVAGVRAERATLSEALRAAGATVEPSQANFVFARVRDPVWLRDGLAGLGIAIRAFPGRPGLEDAVRITLPGRAEALRRLTSGVGAVLRPERVVLPLELLLAGGGDGAEARAAEVAGLARRVGVVVVAPGEGGRDTVGRLGLPDGVLIVGSIAEAASAPGWLVSPRVDDLRDARRAGLVPVGISADAGEALTAAGAARVVTHLGCIEEWLP